MKAKILLSVIMAAVLSLVPCAFAQQAGQDPRALDRFKNALEQEGFNVKSGQSKSLDMWQQYCSGVTSSAKYNNKGAPYLTAEVPHLEGDPTLIPYTFQLRADEAIVFIGETPPPVTYFSYQPFLLNKHYAQPVPADLRTSPIQGCGGDPHCLDVGTTLGDTVNVATIKTIGPDPYSAPMVLIFTPDQNTDARVRSALQKAGYPLTIINTIVFPASLVNLGIGQGYDIFMILGRNAKWLNGEAGEAAGLAYMNSLNNKPDSPVPSPVSVFRVTPKVFSAAGLNPLPAPELRVRGTGKTEMGLMGKLDDIRDKVISQYTNMGYVVAAEYTSGPGSYDGYDFIQQMKRAYLDCRDTIYVGAGADAFPNNLNYDITLTDKEFLVIYGVNHTATGKASYMNLNAYAKPSQLAIGSVFDTDFAHSADAYLPSGDPAASQMFAYKISWQCGDERSCLQMSSGDCASLQLDGPEHTVERENTKLAFATRSYLEPATSVGPAFTEVVYHRMIKFSPRP
ncbi:MAG: hypothetical protein PHR66_12575 [Desulfuromonadaceae bacterium]|nr:hypothetical protein [Desulfuromonadaceae bacterium]